MSYILDALKKSEEARGPRKTRGLLDVPIRSSQPRKRSRRWPYLIALIMFLNAGFFVFWLHPWQGDGNLDASSSRITGGSFPETRPQAAPATQPARLAQAVENQGNAQSQAEAPPHLPVSEAPKAAPRIPGGERGGELSTTESSGQTANPVEPSKIAAVSPAVNGTQSIHETAQDHVVETKVPPKDPGAMQSPKTGPVHTDPVPAKLPSATPGASKTTSAAVKKPVSPKPPQNTGGAGTKQSLKTAKADTAVQNPPARFEQSIQPSAGSGIVEDLKGLPKPAARPEPKWHELAPQVKDAMPNMSVSMLVYSRKPEERWINVNGAKRREGQEISSGLKVEEITPDGAIFSYQGQRFYKGVVGD